MSTDILQPRSPNTRLTELTGRFAAISALTDGWLDGAGRAPNKQKLVEVRQSMLRHYPERVPLPIIIATPDGNLLLEWDVPGDPSLDLDLDSMHAAFHAFLPHEQEIEREFVLQDDDAWGQLFGLLSTVMDQRPG